MIKIRYNFTGYIISLMLFAILGGCVSTHNTSTIPPMALTANPSDTGLNNQLVLMTLKIKNNSELKFKPTVQTINLRNNSTNTLNQYTVATPCRIENDYKIYLLSFSLPAGDYELLDVEGYSNFQQKQNEITIPLHIHFTAVQEGVVYLGSINTVLQKQTDVTSLWVGAMSPLFDQATNDFAGGNYIINVSDDYAEDMTDFSNKYPELIDQNIVKSILSGQQQLLEES